MFTNKVRVVGAHGAGSDLGMLDPKVNMQVYTSPGNLRYVVNPGHLSGTIGLALTEGGTEVIRVYPHEVYTTLAIASGTWAFPNTDSGSIKFGHDGVYSTAELKQAADPADGVIMLGSGVPFTFE